MKEDPLTIAPWPRVDFSEFGEVERQPLTRIQSLTARFMARNWAMIPHVTHHDEADLSVIDSSRRELSRAIPGSKLTALSFIIKACAQALTEFRMFNASYEAADQSIIYKKYVHVGFAVDTPKGLIVPVIRDCDRKGVIEIANEVAALADQARTKGLPMAAMSGGCFTVSSLGAQGGLGFTPIINAPELAILGVSRRVDRPIKAADGGVAWTTVAPLSLSYDHRVINGMDASRFMTRLVTLLTDPTAMSFDEAAS